MKLRLLVANSRALAAAAVGALALGIGITALMFAIVDGTVRRGLPVPDPAAVVHLDRVTPATAGARAFRIAEREPLAAAGALSQIAGYVMAQTTITAPGVTPRAWSTAIVTPDTFAILHAEPARGRAFTGPPSASDASPVLISDQVWRQQFGADEAIVGRAVLANGAPATIAGVMPPGFMFPIGQHVWRLLDERSQAPNVNLWGRLAAGVSAREAGDRLSAAYAALPEARSPDGTVARVTAAPFTEFGQPELVSLLDMLFLAGVGVLVIACANVANLLLARGLARRRDFAIAGALGASRARVMRERLVEGLALAVPGAALGIALTYAGVELFNRSITAFVPPYWVSVAVDGRVLTYAVLMAVASALIAAALPAWRSGRTPLTTVLADEARGSTSGAMRRTTALLIAVEIALAAGVLIAAGLMTRGIVKLASADYIFALDEVTKGHLALPARTYRDPGMRRTFYETLHARLRGQGLDAAIATSIPFSAEARVPFLLDGRQVPEAAWPDVYRVVASPGYFSTLGVNLIAGRDFETGDRLDRPRVAIVNLSFALRYARREDLIGRQFRLQGADAAPITIIGVAPDLAVGNARGERPEAIYLPLLQQPTPPAAATVLARATGGGAVEPRVRSVLAGLDPDLPIERVMTLAGFRETATWYYGVFGGLFLVFGAGALVLALVGVYAVMSFAVTRRHREIGTRMALGATRRDVARLFLREGSVRLAAGLAAGALLALWLTPRLSLFLFQVSPRDPGVYAAALALVAAVGLSACAVPALRAARNDPNQSLRD